MDHPHHPCRGAGRWQGRDREGALALAGRSWREDGRLSARYWSEAVKERKDPAGIFHGAADSGVNARTSGVYTRADPEDLGILDGRDDRRRAELIAERLGQRKAITNA